MSSVLGREADGAGGGSLPRLRRLGEFSAVAASLSGTIKQRQVQRC